MRVARRWGKPGSPGFNFIWASMRETLTLMLANNKFADQPAHPCSLISAFVIRYLKSKVTTCMSYISLFVGFSMIKPLATPLGYTTLIPCHINV